MHVLSIYGCTRIVLFVSSIAKGKKRKFLQKFVLKKKISIDLSDQFISMTEHEIDSI